VVVLLAAMPLCMLFFVTSIDKHLSSLN